METSKTAVLVGGWLGWFGFVFFLFVFHCSRWGRVWCSCHDITMYPYSVWKCIPRHCRKIPFKILLFCICFVICFLFCYQFLYILFVFLIFLLTKIDICVMAVVANSRNSRIPKLYAYVAVLKVILEEHTVLYVKLTMDIRQMNWCRSLFGVA